MSRKKGGGDLKHEGPKLAQYRSGSKELEQITYQKSLTLDIRSARVQNIPVSAC